MKNVFWIILVFIIIILAFVFFSSDKEEKTTGPALDEEQHMVDDKEAKEQEEVVDDGGGGNEEVAQEMMLEDGTYTFDTVESSIGWIGRNSLVGKSHPGTFMLHSGEIVIEKGLVSGGFEIDMQSLVGDSDGLTEHLRDGDFFAVDMYPRGSFTIQAVDMPDAEGHMNVTGDLTIKDTTASVTFPVSLVQDAELLVVTGDFKIDRTKWGITFGSGSFFENLGDSAIDDTVDVTLGLRSNKVD